MYPDTLPARLRGSIGIAALMLVAACSRDSLAPSPQVIASMGAPAATKVPGPPALRSNTIKYRDSGVKPATGRSGTATLAVRALLSRQGKVLVEATTGSFEGVAPRGQITKVQLTHVVPGDTLTTNFGTLVGGGYWSHSLDGLRHGSPIQVQANIRGIDGRRTDVVTVRTTAVRRPNLAVSAFSAPARVLQHQPISISAVVRETNGDVGARADCALLVDGVQRDRASGIWVDEGDAVTCEFRNVTFAALGTRQVRIEVYDVVPGDWDESDNGVSGTVEVLSPEAALPWTMQFMGDDREVDLHVEFSSDFGTMGFGRTGTSSYREASLEAANVEMGPFDGAVTFFAQLTSGGDLLGIATAEAYEWEGFGWECRNGDDVAMQTEFSLCWQQGSSTRTLQVTHRSTRVVYIGYSYQNMNGHLPANVDETTGFGAFQVRGAFGMDVKVMDAAGSVWRANGQTPITSSTTYESCAESWWYASSCRGGETVTRHTGSASSN